MQNRKLLNSVEEIKETLAKGETVWCDDGKYYLQQEDENRFALIEKEKFEGELFCLGILEQEDLFSEAGIKYFKEYFTCEEEAENRVLEKAPALDIRIKKEREGEKRNA